ncbi:glyoxalase superfamily protein [Breoghania sp. L-A4]|uniref:glyoxalase superfamily protein n=1 Tax=Breoghania sp. L-A4 TaxID=2304600 RepID=UPI0013C2C47F|nr:glyoxalase superfamily protein [Breoghania sp. L-A4]
MNTLPSIETLKLQARRLRAELTGTGAPVNHGRALEMLAHQYGYRDWNTLHASVGNQPRPVNVGETVSGRYLGQPFTGTVIGVRLLGDSGHRRVTFDFDEPVDVVTFDSFSAYRKRVTCVLTEDGVTVERTSNGQPHMRLDV